MTEPTYLTAEQARALMPSVRIERELQAVLESIAEAAKCDYNSLRFPYHLTTSPGDNLTPTGLQVSYHLRSLGYRITPQWVEAQFVDAYVLIEWGAE